MRKSDDFALNKLERWIKGTQIIESSHCDFFLLSSSQCAVQKKQAKPEWMRVLKKLWFYVHDNSLFIGEFRSKVACENDIMSFECNPYSRIAVNSASYGRTEYESLQCPQQPGIKEESK